MLPSSLPSSDSEAQQQASNIANNFSQSFRSILPGGGTNNEKDTMGAWFPEVSYETRLYGFIGCAVAGLVVSLLSTLFLSFGQVVSFAILYTVGNFIALFATAFLVGFKRQIKSMCDPNRIIATIIFVGSLILTLIVAFKSGNVIFVIFFIIIQWLAGAWYIASYIPFARDAMTSCCKAGVGV
uniref:Vesicle transport protein n=1 Tax=Aplanochytrium stocchinoi TaxID=215587 RepID=A0A7S3LJU5_9STRA|mmetsp:Transcript_2610/g.3306  ORF Transcript_2610/g.3306 Transcript_2610/m.3306 type:complete len:183 (+) Transcript_2610:30-578(+)